MTATGFAGTQAYAKGGYPIIKGPPGLRNIVKGTRYLATNPQIVQLGLGIKGARHVAKGGFVLGLVVSSGVEIADFIFNDEKTMCDLVGGIGVEAVKAGLGALLAFGLGALATFTGIVALPLGVMLGVAFVAGWGLNMLDETFQIKQKVVAMLKAAPSDIENGFYIVKEQSLLFLKTMGDQRLSTKDTQTLQLWDVAVKDAFRLLMRRY